LKVGAKQILGWGSATVSIIIGLRLLDILLIDSETLTNAIMLLVLGFVLIVETYKEKTFDFRKAQTGDYVMIVLSIFAIVIGIIELVSVWVKLPDFPKPIYGSIGLLYIILAVLMVIKTRD
jgi:hypothetical protein